MAPGVPRRFPIETQHRAYARGISSIALATAISIGTVACGGSGTNVPTTPAVAATAAAGAATNPPGPVTPNVSSPSGETPRSADAFVDTAGVNVHLSNYSSFYGNFGVVLSLLTTLGIRHVRDGVAIGQPTVCSEDAQLAAAGIHLDLISATDVDMPALQAWLTCLGTSVESVEAPNEYDTSHDVAWPTVLTSYVQSLYPAVKPAKVLAPALVTEQAFLSFGSIGASVDEGNMHDYFAGRNPGTSGWGDTDTFGTYGSLAFDMHLAALTSGNKPVVATETGYSDAVDQYALPPATKARYTLRTLLEHWNAGVVRTYFYEFADEGSPPFSHYGIVDGTGNAKPVYVALKNLLAHLTDPGGTFAMTPLAYNLAANPIVHHTLLQKRNGRYALILWVEQPEWDPNKLTAIAVAAQPVQLTFAHAPSALAATVFNDAGDVTTSALTPSNGTTSLTITASPTIVDITP